MYKYEKKNLKYNRKIFFNSLNVLPHIWTIISQHQKFQCVVHKTILSKKKKDRNVPLTNSNLKHLYVSIRIHDRF